jgi:hypothetical protein
MWDEEWADMKVQAVKLLQRWILLLGIGNFYKCLPKYHLQPSKGHWSSTGWSKYKPLGH